jgi:hypothetical protein
VGLFALWGCSLCEPARCAPACVRGSCLITRSSRPTYKGRLVAWLLGWLLGFLVGWFCCVALAQILWHSTMRGRQGRVHSAGICKIKIKLLDGLRFATGLENDQMGF